MQLILDLSFSEEDCRFFYIEGNHITGNAVEQHEENTELTFALTYPKKAKIKPD